MPRAEDEQRPKRRLLLRATYSALLLAALLMVGLIDSDDRAEVIAWQESRLRLIVPTAAYVIGTVLACIDGFLLLKHKLKRRV